MTWNGTLQKVFEMFSENFATGLFSLGGFSMGGVSLCGFLPDVTEAQDVNADAIF